MTRRRQWEMRRHRDGWWWLFEAIGWVKDIPARIDTRLARAATNPDDPEEA